MHSIYIIYILKNIKIKRIPPNAEIPASEQHRLHVLTCDIRNEVTLRGLPLKKCMQRYTFKGLQGDKWEGKAEQFLKTRFE